MTNHTERLIDDVRAAVDRALDHVESYNGEGRKEEARAMIDEALVVFTHENPGKVNLHTMATDIHRRAVRLMDGIASHAADSYKSGDWTRVERLTEAAKIASGIKNSLARLYELEELLNR